MKKIISSIIFGVLLLSLSGCKKISKYEETPPSIDNYPLTVNNVEFSEPPKTVVSLSPSITEILFELNVSDKIIGKTTYCTYPEDISGTVVGSSANPDIDAIIGLSPDLLIYQSPISLNELELIQASGVKTLYLPSPKSYTELTDLYTKLGVVFYGKSDSYNPVKDALEPLTTTLDSIYDSYINTSFVFFVKTDSKVATGDTLAGNILSIFGENIAEDELNYKMDIDSIVEANPKIIIIPTDFDKEDLDKKIKELDAYKNDLVFTINPFYFERPSVRMISEINSLFEKISITPPLEDSSEVSQAD